jgi:hypothetical protein
MKSPAHDRCQRHLPSGRRPASYQLRAIALGSLVNNILFSAEGAIRSFSVPRSNSIPDIPFVELYLYFRRRWIDKLASRLRHR